MAADRATDDRARAVSGERAATPAHHHFRSMDCSCSTVNAPTEQAQEPLFIFTVEFVEQVHMIAAPGSCVTGTSVGAGTRIASGSARRHLMSREALPCASTLAHWH